MNLERRTVSDQGAPDQPDDLDARIAAAAEAAMQDPRYAAAFGAEAEAASLQRAEADIAAGRLVPHEAVVAWLETWGTPDFKPMPREWLE